LGTATRTVCFTDLANYTAKVARSDREGLRRILKEHEALVGPIVEKYGGKIIKNLGDSFLILFNAATDSLRAALDIQHLQTDSGGIQIRLAMNTGDVEEIDGDAFGESVNLASRISGKTPAGEIWFGAGTMACMNQAEIPWESVGRFRMKGIPGEQELFRAIPKHKAWLPDPVAQAAKVGNLVRLQFGSRPPLLPPDPVLLFEGFTPGSRALQQAVDSLPVINPASMWLATYNVSPTDRLAWTETGRGMVIGTPEAIEAAIQESLKAVSRSSGSDTIVLDMSSQAELELVVCGLALPAVPMSEVVASYSYDLLADGQWVTTSDRAILRADVNPDGVTVTALCPGIAVNGRTLSSGESVVLFEGDTVTSPPGSLKFRSADAGYAGLLLSNTDMRLGVAEGQTAELGREPNHPGLAFPDRRGQDNIRWCSGPRAARARAGGFTLDRALAGRRQAAIQIYGETMSLTPLHARCPTYILRGDDARLERADATVGVQVDDLIVAGTTVVALRAPE